MDFRTGCVWSSVVWKESLPADHAPISVKVSLPCVSTENLLACIQNLGSYVVCSAASLKLRNFVQPVQIKTGNEDLFVNIFAIVKGSVDLSNVDDAVK